MFLSCTRPCRFYSILLAFASAIALAGGTFASRSRQITAPRPSLPGGPLLRISTLRGETTMAHRRATDPGPTESVRDLSSVPVGIWRGWADDAHRAGIDGAHAYPKR